MYFSDAAVNRFRKSGPILYSFLIHASIVVIAFLITWQGQLDLDKQHERESYQIDSIVDHQKPKKDKIPLVKKGTSQTSKSKTDRMAIPSLSSLAMRMTPQTPLQEEEQPRGDKGDSETQDAWDMLNPDPRQARFNQYLYYTVQGWLDRDAYLNTQKIYGTVKLKIWFTEKGEWLEDETEFDAIDDNFKGIVRRALRKSFERPIPLAYITQKHKFFIVRTVVVRGNG